MAVFPEKSLRDEMRYEMRYENRPQQAQPTVFLEIILELEKNMRDQGSQRKGSQTKAPSARFSRKAP